MAGFETASGRIRPAPERAPADTLWGADSDMETLAALVAKQRNAGHRFAAVQSSGERPEKDAARRRILDAFTAEAWPGRLEILTLPGASWIFETELLRQRENVSALKKRWPKRTIIRSLERDPAIFAAALTRMPSVEDGAPGNGKMHVDRDGCCKLTRLDG